MPQSLTFRTRLPGEYWPHQERLGQTHACPAAHLGWPLAEHQRSQPPWARSQASRAVLKVGVWAGCKVYRAAQGRSRDPSCGEEWLSLERRCVFAGESWTPLEPHSGLGLPWVLQVGHAHINMGRPQKTQKLKKVSLLDIVGQSLFPLLRWRLATAKLPAFLAGMEADSPSSCKKHSCNEQMQRRLIMKEGDPWRSAASAGLPPGAQTPKPNTEEVKDKWGALGFKAAVVASHKVEAQKPEERAAVEMRNKMTKQDAQLQKISRKEGGIFLKHCQVPKERRQGLKVGEIIKSE